MEAAAAFWYYSPPRTCVFLYFLSTDPSADKRVPGWVNGYVRRFWQVRVVSARFLPAANGGLSLRLILLVPWPWSFIYSSFVA